MDEGGYQLKEQKKYMNLKHSDIKMNGTYLDRFVNTRKKLSEHIDSIFAHAFTMQQAVEKMINRWDADVR